MTKYKVGDKIVMTALANDAYGITCEGSEGVITEIHGILYYIDFYKVTDPHDIKQVYSVESRFFKLLEPAEELTPAQIIEKRIQRMWKRQNYAKQQAMV